MSYRNQFTWFKDPNFKIEDSSSDEEDNNQYLEFNLTLNRNLRPDRMSLKNIPKSPKQPKSSAKVMK